MNDRLGPADTPGPGSTPEGRNAPRFPRPRSTASDAAAVLARSCDAVRALDRLPMDLSQQALAELVSDLVELRRLIDPLCDNLVLALRARGASWAELGKALGVHRSTAKARYERATGNPRKPSRARARKSAGKTSETGPHSPDPGPTGP